MKEKVVWIVFLTVLALLGVSVSVVPVRMARLLGASPEMQQSKYLQVWRVIGVIVFAGAVIKLLSEVS
jgi:amino acid permease